MNPTLPTQALIRANPQNGHSELKAVIGPKPDQTAPQVTCHRTEDVIQSIEIRCACGEVIVLDCKYQ